MKLDLYYVVRIYEGGTDSIGRSSDCQYVDGPFGSYSQAVGSRGSHVLSGKLDIVTQTIEVEK